MNHKKHEQARRQLRKEREHSARVSDLWGQLMRGTPRCVGAISLPSRPWPAEILEAIADGVSRIGGMDAFDDAKER